MPDNVAQPVAQESPEKPKLRGEHLKKHQFKPGNPGSKGRPKGSIDLWSRVRNKLREKVKEGPHSGKEFADLVADAIVKGVLQGKWPQTKELLDREEGPIGDTKQPTNIIVQVVYREAPPIESDNGRMSEHAGNHHN